MADEEEKPIRVVDRRMFTPDGELRPEYRAEGGAEAPSAPKPASEPTRAPASLPPESERPPAGQRADATSGGAFALIVQLLSMPAYAALGMVPDPASGRRRIDRPAAQEIIDLLAVLEQKTRGNLSFEESTFLSRVLYDLRLAFVEVGRPPAR
jgi:uncharacterized protein DUF1844